MFTYTMHQVISMEYSACSTPCSLHSPSSVHLNSPSLARGQNSLLRCKLPLEDSSLLKSAGEGLHFHTVSGGIAVLCCDARSISIHKYKWLRTPWVAPITLVDITCTTLNDVTTSQNHLACCSIPEHTPHAWTLFLNTRASCVKTTWVPNTCNIT